MSTELSIGRRFEGAQLDTGQRDVYILPTRYGLLFGGALLLILLVSVNYNNGLGHLFTFVMASSAIVCMHYTQRNLVGLSIRADAGKPVFAGEKAHFRIHVHDLIQRARFVVWLRAGEHESSFDLDADEDRAIDVAVSAQHRGWLAVPESYLCTVYPLGIFLSWTRRFRSDAVVLVYPTPAPEQPLPEIGDGEKELKDSRLLRGNDDFSGIRDHQSTDGINRIHWKHSARGTGLKTKLFQGMTAGDLVLHWEDTTPTDSEGRLSQLTRWVLDAEAAGYRYGLEIPGEKIQPESGATHQHRCLKALALWGETR